MSKNRRGNMPSVDSHDVPAKGLSDTTDDGEYVTICKDVGGFKLSKSKESISIKVGEIGEERFFTILVADVEVCLKHRNDPYTFPVREWFNSFQD